MSAPDILEYGDAAGVLDYPPEWIAVAQRVCDHVATPGSGGRCAGCGVRCRESEQPSHAGTAAARLTTTQVESCPTRYRAGATDSTRRRQ